MMLKSMTRKRLLLCSVSLLFTFTAQASSLEEVEKVIRDSFNEYNSIRSDLRIEASIPMQDIQIPVSGEGKMEYMKGDDGGKFRQAFTLSAPEPIEMEVDMTVISDGRETVIISEMMGIRNVMRQNAELSQGTVPPGGEDLLSALKRETDLLLMDDSEIDGHAVYVIEAKPKVKADTQFSSALIHIDKKLGVTRLITMHEEGKLKSIGNIRFYNIELNPSLSPENFRLDTESPPSPATPSIP